MYVRFELGAKSEYSRRVGKLKGRTAELAYYTMSRELGRAGRAGDGTVRFTCGWASEWR